MPVRLFCDICNEETQRNYVATRIRGEAYISSPIHGDKISIEVMTGIGAGRWNNGILCHACLKEAAVRVIDSDARNDN